MNHWQALKFDIDCKWPIPLTDSISKETYKRTFSIYSAWSYLGCNKAESLFNLHQIQPKSATVTNCLALWCVTSLYNSTLRWRVEFSGTVSQRYNPKPLQLSQRCQMITECLFCAPGQFEQLIALICAQCFIAKYETLPSLFWKLCTTRNWRSIHIKWWTERDWEVHNPGESLSMVHLTVLHYDETFVSLCSCHQRPSTSKEHQHHRCWSHGFGDEL